MPFATNCPELCPPSDASPAVGIIFRFVRTSPVSPGDMRSWEDEGRSPGVGDPCMRCALSVLVDWNDVQQARATIPVFRKRKVASATLSGVHGRVKQTGNNAWHHSLWVERECASSIHCLFGVVES